MVGFHLRLPVLVQLASALVAWRAGEVGAAGAAKETPSSRLCMHAAHVTTESLRKYSEKHFGAAIHGISNLSPGTDKALADLAGSLTGASMNSACNGGRGGCEISQTTKMIPHRRLCGNDWPPFGFTMVGIIRLINVAQLISNVVRTGVQGDFAELGVWRGGTCIFAQRLFGVLEPSKTRMIHVFDAFESLPGYGGNSAFLENSAADVRENFEVMGAMSKHVKFHVGLFQQTTKAFQTEHDVTNTRLAILRIDGNFYDSYQDALYRMYEYVPVGGYVIFDDVMSHAAVMRCWEDFKADQGLPETLTRIDKHSAYFQKIADTRIDPTKEHPAQDVNKKYR